MRPSVTFAPLLLLAVLVTKIHSSEGAGNTGSLTWGQPCNSSATLHDNPSTRCDTSKRLSCDMKGKTCKCHHEDRDFYNSETDRCEIKVGKFCSSSETFPTICVHNAVCDAQTNFCICDEGAEANKDGTECEKEDSNSATPITSKQGFPFQVAITIFTIVAGTRIF